MLFGRTEPFDEDALTALYPDGKEEYLKRFGGSLDATIAAGFILEDDREEILAVAALSYPLRAIVEGCPGGVYELRPSQADHWDWTVFGHSASLNCEWSLRAESNPSPLIS